MDAFCSICGHRWDARDPGVRYIYGEGTWECADEGLCFDRRALDSLEGEAARSPEYWHGPCPELPPKWSEEMAKGE